MYKTLNKDLETEQGILIPKHSLVKLLWNEPDGKFLVQDTKTNQVFTVEQNAFEELA